MTQQAERTRTIKYVLAKSSRWLLHRRKDTKKMNTPGCRKKNRANDSTGYTLVEPRHIRVPFVYRHYTHAPDHGITRHNKPQRPPDNGHNTA